MENSEKQNLDAASSAVIYRQATEVDFPAVENMYAKLDAFLRKFTYCFPEVENVGELWLDMFRRTLGRFSVLYVAEYEGEIVGFIVARVKRVPAYLGGVMVGELKDMWVEHKVRRLGLGEELLRLAIEWCREQDVHSLEAQILVGNEPILKLVEYLGMKRELYQMRLGWEDYNERE
jgi:RimJ/RimL family protein N-acetyltransferase